MPQYRVLGLLSSGHERATELASKLAVTKPTLTSLIDGLVERGFVAREAHGGRPARRADRHHAGRACRRRCRRAGAARRARRRARALRRPVRRARRPRRPPPRARRPLVRAGRRGRADRSPPDVSVSRASLERRTIRLGRSGTRRSRGRRPPSRVSAGCAGCGRSCAATRRRSCHARVLDRRPGPHRPAAADPAADPRPQHHQRRPAARADARPAAASPACAGSR